MGWLIALAWSGALAQGLITNTYTVSSEDFPNPERGFYIETECWSSSPSAVESDLATLRTNGRTDPGGDYTAKIAVVQRMYYLDLFVNTNISSSFLNRIQTDCNSIRAQGDKAIVRFAYTTSTQRPFTEPTKAQILAHIAQLQPLLATNSDIIAVLQEGFIGTWGEGYYTDIFYTNGQATAQNWADRADVLNAEMAALPATRMIQVRTPQIKQKYVYGAAATVTAAALDSAEALSGDNNSRVAFHNDCYLASADDEGTFDNYDYGSTTSTQTITNLRSYLAQETRYAAMAGETCAVNPPDDSCSSVGGRADSDMTLFHYSLLNELYFDGVDDKWATGGCIEAIKRQMGYRLQLVSGIFRTEAQPGQEIPFTLEFQNVGYAAPYNPRGLELILSNNVSGQKYFAELSRDTDVRWWLPGSNQVLNAKLSLPPNLPPGSYDLRLHLPDPAPTLYGRVPYSIQLANSNAVASGGAVLGSVWDPTTGYHWLRQTLNVNTTATNPAPGALDVPVLNYSAVRENYSAWQARNFPTNTAVLGAPGADPDGDGRPNLFEYAVGSNPNSGGDSNYFNLSLSNAALIVTIQKGPGVKDVCYAVESSSNAVSGSWSTSQVTMVNSNAVYLQASFPVTNTAGFLRLKVTQLQ